MKGKPYYYYYRPDHWIRTPYYVYISQEIGKVIINRILVLVSNMAAPAFIYFTQKRYLLDNF